MADDKKLSNRINAPSESAAKDARMSKDDSWPIPVAPDPRWGVENCCVREFWAVVETDASLVRGRNVLRTARLGTGVYEVFFTGDVSNGAFVATIGRPGIATEPPGEITVALRCCPGLGAWTPFDDNKGVWVETYDSKGSHADRAFHLIVMTH